MSVLSGYLPVEQGEACLAALRRHTDGVVAAGDERTRDQTCREPSCGAPVRHLDHVVRHADGDATTLANGRGLCARHNLAGEHPGWSATVVHDGYGDQPHTVRTNTPTGRTCTARAPDPP